ncbi:MAG: DUF167 domain-containing protein [Dehalococcoidia bacterium]|nr:DUF167 domain-containing protein [Dehalococcoidia bacterium]
MGEDRRMADVTLKLRVTPRARSTEIDGWDGETVSMRVTAPPERGKANEAVLRLLADALGVPVSSLRLVRGRASRDKLVAVDGLATEEVRRRMERCIAERNGG